jgi:hypothetical protein
MNNRAYRIALLCGLTPLVLGVTVFALWLRTRSDALMIVGAFVLWGGVALFAVGAIALLVALRAASRDPSVSARRLRWSAIACAALLLVNFPAATVIIREVAAITATYTLEVRNESAIALENVSLHGGGCHVEWTDIGPGEQRNSTIRFDRDGTLEFDARHGATAISATVEGYVTAGMGGHASVRVRSDGTVSMAHEPVR